MAEKPRGDVMRMHYCSPYINSILKPKIEPAAELRRQRLFQELMVKMTNYNGLFKRKAMLDPSGRDHNAISRAEDVHTAIDHYITEARVKDAEEFKKVKCKKGCAGCCYVQVAATLPEAKRAYAYAKANKIPIDRARLEKQAGMSATDFWKAPREDAKCVFLGDNNECQIYEARPTACRLLHVTSDPAECSPETGTGETDVYYIKDAEILNYSVFNFELNTQYGRMYRAAKIDLPSILLNLLNFNEPKESDSDNVAATRGKETRP